MTVMLVRRAFLALVLGCLVGSLLGTAVLLFDEWRSTYADLTTNAKANISNPPANSARPTR